MGKPITVVIPNVDPDELEAQRLILSAINLDSGSLGQSEVDAIVGVTNMLDAWSDARIDGKLLQMGDRVACKDEADLEFWEETYIFICALPTGSFCVTHITDWEDDTVDWDLIHVQCCKKREVYTETTLSNAQINCLKNNDLWEK